MEKSIVTWQPPIGGFMAYYDGYEPGDWYGFGETRYDAIMNLLLDGEW